MPSKKKKITKVEKGKAVILRLSSPELSHLRDLFSVLLASKSEHPHTISQMLAVLESRQNVETTLWVKIETACESIDLPVGDGAPDFVVGPTGPPTLGIMALSDGDSEEVEGVSASLFKSKN